MGGGPEEGLRKAVVALYAYQDGQRLGKHICQCEIVFACTRKIMYSASNKQALSRWKADRSSWSIR